MKILMVCLGNICRSPIAEGVLQQKAFKAGLTWSIESAGTNDVHTGAPPHLLSQKVCLLHGIDISAQVSRTFVAEDFLQFDKIYAMAHDVMDDIKRISGKHFDQKKADYFLNELYPGANKQVPDPWYGNEDGYHTVYQLIDDTCEAIINNYINSESK